MVMGLIDRDDKFAEKIASEGVRERMRGWNQDLWSDTVTGNVKLECMHMGVSDLDEAEGVENWRS